MILKSLSALNVFFKIHSDNSVLLLYSAKEIHQALATSTYELLFTMFELKMETSLS